MAVRKFRRADSMPGPNPLSPLDPDNLRLACEWSRFATELAGLHSQPGVHRFHSYEELKAARVGPGRNGEAERRSPGS